ncbi:MAG: hypothetical protein GX589_02360 [Deltaproteobacteria bacterium]|nr:hypothetical protein [Deltaproteobacteria bacterium]
MSQLSLNMSGRLVYTSKGFFLHSGVKDLFAKVSALLTQNRFAICFISGGPRTGKTHFSVALGDALAACGVSVLGVEGVQLSRWIAERISRTALRSEEAIIVDDAHLYLEQISSGQSGEFVNLVEAARRAKAKICLFSSKEVDEFGFDEHVRSRLVPGSGFQIGAPDEGELAGLFSLLARQRGMLFSTRKLEYWLKRIGRDIPSIDACLAEMDVLSRTATSENPQPSGLDDVSDEGGVRK